MKIMVYEARPDERADLEKQAALHGVELSVTDAVPTLENASLAAGCIGVSILGQGCIDAALLDAYHALGIRYLSTRTIGYDHIDLDHARSIGLRVCSASYAPNGVADFTVMMILMCLRHYKQALWRQAQAKLLSAGFKLNEVQLVNGEKDWVYGVKYQGRQLTAGEKIPMGASLTLMVGDGAGDTVEEDSIDIDLDTEEPVASESSSTQDDSWF